MIQFVVGAAAGYIFGTRAGRKRFEQIRKGYNGAVNSPVSKAAFTSARKAIANRLDPDPRMREVRQVRPSRGNRNGEPVRSEANPAEHQIFERDDN